MKASKIKIVFLSLGLTMTSLMSFSQMLYWAVPDNTIEMTTLTPSTIPGATGFSYTASNGAYDNAGTLLFYATSMQTGVSIVDPSGTPIQLNPLIYAGSQATFPLQEIAIVPVPLSCKQYYVIWLGSAPALAGVALGYAIIDCNSGVSVATNTTHLESWGANSGGIAVTKAPAGIHYLLVAEKDKLVRFDITATGINNSSIIADQFSAPCFVFPGVEPFEIEVSPDGQKVLLADWITTTGSSKVYELSFSPDVYTASSVIQTTYIYPNPSTFGFGIEYNVDASRIFVSTNIVNSSIGLWWADALPGGGTFNSIASSSAYSQSFLEYGLSNSLNNYIYAVNNNGTLGKIENVDVGNPFIVSTGISATILSNGNSFPAGVPIFSLPDQIDGQNYTNFFTQPSPTVGFTVNNTTVSPVNPIDVCISSPIIMNTLLQEHNIRSAFTMQMPMAYQGHLFQRPDGSSLHLRQQLIYRIYPVVL